MSINSGIIEPQDYTKNLKDNPAFEAGMMVCAYSHYDSSMLVGIGRVTSLVWSEFYLQYILNINWFDGRSGQALAGDCERLVYSGAALREFFKGMNHGRGR